MNLCPRNFELFRLSSAFRKKVGSVDVGVPVRWYGATNMQSLRIFFNFLVKLIIK